MVMNAVVLMSVWMGAALAAEEEAPEGVKSMLDAIPEIVSPQAAVEEEKKPEPQGIDLDGYFRVCRTAVYAHFKMPKKIAKANPGVEIFFLVTVDEEGNILGVTSPKRSGFKAWDAAALAALNKLGQLPAPPRGWSSASDKVLIPFNKQSR
jgi:TonB family protein